MSTLEAAEDLDKTGEDEEAWGDGDMSCPSVPERLTTTMALRETRQTLSKEWLDTRPWINDMSAEDNERVDAVRY